MENLSKSIGEKIIPRNGSQVTPQSISVSTFSGIFMQRQPANTSISVVRIDTHASDFGRFYDTDQMDAKLMEIVCRSRTGYLMIMPNCNDISTTTSSVVTTVQPPASNVMNANGNASNMPHTSAANGSSDVHVKMEYDSDVEIVDEYQIGAKRPSPTVVGYFDFTLDSDDDSDYDIRLTSYKPRDEDVKPIIKREFS